MVLRKDPTLVANALFYIVKFLSKAAYFLEHGRRSVENLFKVYIYLEISLCKILIKVGQIQILVVFALTSLHVSSNKKKSSRYVHN